MSVRRKTAILLILLSTIIISGQTLAQEAALQAGTSEFRGLWVDTWGDPGPYNATQTSILVDTAAAANYNAIIFEVRKCGDAYYESAYEPWARNIGVTDPLYDPLADMLAKAHEKGIEVHAWVIPWRIWNKNWPSAPDYHVFKTHPEWAHKTWMGQDLVGTYYELDPGVPAVQQYVCDVIKDMVSKYDVDGVNFDRIRYPEASFWYSKPVNPWGYNNIARERFRRDYGVYPPTSSSSPMWATWCDFRRNMITDFVRKCYAECVFLKPGIKMSADTVAWMQGDPVADFTSTRAYYEVFQDHKKWMQEHILDMNVLMNYKREHDTAQAKDFRLWTDYLVQNRYDRHVINGPAAYLNAISGTITQLLLSRNAGLDGVSTYNYRSHNKDGAPADAFYGAIKSGVFPEPAPVPDMPWKSAPTDGILFGQVTDGSMPNDPVYGNWVYKANVTASGPIVKTFQTDGTGTFVMMDMPPGAYSVSVSAFGLKPATGTIVVTAGGATRLDFRMQPVDAVAVSSLSTVPDGTQVRILGNIVTSSTGDIPGYVYVESPGRIAGLKIKPIFWAADVVEGDQADYVGVLTTENGERVLDSARLLSKTSATAIRPLFTKAKDIDAAPTMNAVLVQCAGRTVESGDGWFTVNDGSGIVKVVCPGKTVPGAGTLVRATGITMPAEPRTIQVRYQSDIEIDPATLTLTSPTNLVGRGYNTLGVPCVPVDPAPTTVFANFSIDGRLFKWINGCGVPCKVASLDSFGGILMGEGYALNTEKPAGISYQAIADQGAADMRIPLRTKGWNFFSPPFNKPVRYGDMLVTDGKVVLTAQQAVMARWIQVNLFTWNNNAQMMAYVPVKASYFQKQMEYTLPWHGYWIVTCKENLALIIPNSAQ